jgi:endogenous inhibitor of DNA gyrase (YacG/DUF329 family)
VAAHPCPICKKPVEPGPEKPAAWPFCSSRCRLIDLGNWLGGNYAIPGEEQPTDDDKQHDD